MSHGFFLARIEARAFEDYVDLEFFPGAVHGVFFRIDLNGLAVYRDRSGFVVGGDIVFVSALSGVVFEKVREHFRAGEVVDGDYGVALGAEHLPESKTSDTAETVDCNFY